MDEQRIRYILSNNDPKCKFIFHSTQIKDNGDRADIYYCHVVGIYRTIWHRSGIGRQVLYSCPRMSIEPRLIDDFVYEYHSKRKSRSIVRRYQRKRAEKNELK